MAEMAAHLVDGVLGVDGLFWQSGLDRAKWERADYRAWTLARACYGRRA
jgi:hypothetical protein